MPRTARRVTTAPEVTLQTQLLTDKQVMQLLGVSRTGLHYLMRKGGLPYIKLGESRGAALRFNAGSVEQWLVQNEHRVTA